LFSHSSYCLLYTVRPLLAVSPEPLPVHGHIPVLTPLPLDLLHQCLMPRRNTDTPQTNLAFRQSRSSHRILGQLQQRLHHGTRQPTCPWPMEGLLHLQRHHMRGRFREHPETRRRSQNGPHILLLRE
jgi:hypothetical protein